MIRTPVARLALLGLLLGCNGADLVLPTEGEPAAIAVVEGDDQSGRVGEPLAQPIVARVTDSRGRPVVGVPVELDLGTDGEVSPAAGQTDGAGDAVFQVTLGTRVGSLDAQVSVVPSSGDPTIVAPLRLTALSADAAGIAIVSGDGQSAPVGTALAEPLTIQVSDVFGNPIAGVEIGWTVENGGSVSSTTVPTDADGRASVLRVLGPAAGEQRTLAGAEGLAGSPVVFVHTATAGSAARLEAVSGDGQSAIVGTSLANDLVVRLLDPEGNPVAGTAVAWVVGEGAGSVAPETTPTDAEGLAATRWTLGGQPGVQTVSAVVSGVGVVPFTATAQPGTPPGLRLVTQPAATARRGSVLGRQPVVQLVDPSGVELRQAGVQVTVSVAAGGGRARGTLTRTTDGEGRAVFTDLALEGPAGTYTLAFRAEGYTGVVSGAIALSRAVTTLTITADTPDPSLPGASVRVAYAVGSEGGQPGGNVTVRAEDGATCQASVTAGACALTLSAVGTQTITATYEGDVEFEPASDTQSHTVDAPATPTLSLATQPSQNATAGVPFGRQPVVQLRDGAGGALQTAGVTVTVGIASGGGTLLGQASRTTDASGRASFEGLGIAGATGPHTLRFTADGYIAAASATIEVQGTATTLRIDADTPDPSTPGQAVTVRFTLTSPAGTPPGDVTVSSGALSCTAPATAGACDLVFGQAGSFTITAAYGGGGGFAAASDEESHTVQTVAPPGPSASASTVALEPSSVGVGAQATARVTVRDANGEPLAGIETTLAASGPQAQVSPGSAPTNGSGVAEFSVRASSPGAVTLTAVAGGVTLDQRPVLTIIQAGSEVGIEDTPDPSDIGQAITVRVTVRGNAGTPGGQVAVTADGGLQCTITLDNGAGSCSITPTAAGTLTIRAAYAGNETYQPSEATESHEVRTPAARVLQLRTEPSDEATVGEPLDRQPEVQLALDDGGEVREPGVTVSAAVSGGATLEGPTTAVTDGNGRARFDDLAISGPNGSYILSFTADGFAPVSSGAIQLGLAATRTQITGDDPDPSAPGQSFQVQFRVEADGGSPGGSVTVSGGGATCTGSLDGSGEGSCELALSQEGDATLTAVYAGSDRFEGSQDEESHRVEAPNGPPTAADDEFSMLEDGATLEIGAPGVLANDQDPNGDALVAEQVEAPGPGSASVSSGGAVRYAPPADFAGEAVLRYQARDGQAVSAPATVAIQVQPVNDAPSFVGGSDQAVSAAAGPTTVPGWASAISPGPGETDQTVRFEVAVVEGRALLESEPTVSPNGDLTFDPAAPGVAAAQVRLVDDGGTALGGTDASGPVTLRISVVPSAAESFSMR